MAVSDLMNTANTWRKRGDSIYGTLGTLPNLSPYTMPPGMNQNTDKPEKVEKLDQEGNDKDANTLTDKKEDQNFVKSAENDVTLENAEMKAEELDKDGKDEDADQLEKDHSHVKLGDNNVTTNDPGHTQNRTSDDSGHTENKRSDHPGSTEKMRSDDSGHTENKRSDHPGLTEKMRSDDSGHRENKRSDNSGHTKNKRSDDLGHKEKRSDDLGHRPTENRRSDDPGHTEHKRSVALNIPLKDVLSGTTRSTTVDIEDADSGELVVSFDVQADLY